jgi:hypothetical protein
MVLIMDYSGMKQRSFGFQTLWYLKSIYMFHERYFPGRFEKIFMINTSATFLALWRWIKPWLSSSLLERIYILDASEIHVLHEFVDLENLPNFLKGTCKTCVLSTECVPSALSLLDERGPTALPPS